MARARKSRFDLARILESLSAPIYALDDERRIVFCNAACAQWVGQPPEALLGQPCHYHSHADAATPASALTGLCPPCDLALGAVRLGQVTVTSANGSQLRRSAQFLPLAADGDQPSLILAIVGDHDLAQGVPATAELSETEQLHAEVQRFRARFASRHRADRLIGASPASRRVAWQAEMAARTTAPVMIVGPTGTGKSHLARTIHYLREDAAATLVTIDAATATAELLLELATRASSSAPPPTIHTLLVANIESIPAEAQPALLNLITTTPARLQVIGTSTVGIASAAAEQPLLPELAALLTTVSIELTALSARSEDVPMLAQALLEELNARGGKQVGGFSPEALDRLAGYSFSGNVDELAAMVAELHAAVAGPTITSRDLSPRLKLASDAARHAPRPVETIDLEDFLAKIERELIERALARAKGNKSTAARLLSLTRPKLYRRMEQLGLLTPGETADEKGAAGDNHPTTAAE